MYERLKIIRKRLSLNQTQMGALFGITQGGWGAYENGKRKIPNEILKQLIKQYDVNLNWLFTGEGPVFIKDLYTDPPALSNHVAEPEAVYAELDNKTNTMLFGLLRDEQITPGELLDAVIHIRRVRRRSQTKTVSLPS